MKKGGQVGAELGGQSEWEFSGQVDGIFHGGLNKINKKYKAVYTACSSGKGPGRKSLIPAFCISNNIAITGSNPYVVGLCRHKYHCNNILDYNKIPSAKAWYYHKDYKWLSQQEPENGTLVIAKLTYESASIGIGKNSIFEYNNSIIGQIEELSENFNQPITVQEFIPGYEVEVPIITSGNSLITVDPIGIEINQVKLLNNNILTYDIVYRDMYSFYNFQELGLNINDDLLHYTEETSRLLGIEGLGRIDFRISSDGNLYVIDVSTTPHITKHSSFWHLFKNIDRNYSDIFALILSLTAEKYKWY